MQKLTITHCIHILNNHTQQWKYFKKLNGKKQHKEPILCTHVHLCVMSKCAEHGLVTEVEDTFENEADTIYDYAGSSMGL